MYVFILYIYILTRNVKKVLEKQEDMNYADMIRAIDDIREATEREEAQMRRFVTDNTKKENLEVSGLFFTNL